MDEHDWLAEQLRGAPDPPAGGRLPDAGLARARPTTRCRRPGCGSAERTPSDVENLRRLADDGRRPRVPEHAALARGRGARSRSTVHVPDPIVSRADGVDPEHEALLADSVGLALLVVLDTLTPAERLAFVLHDMFAVPFDEIAPIVGRSPDGGAPARQPRPPPGAGRERRARRRPRRASARSSTPSSPPRATATSTRSSPCSTPTSCCAPTAARARPERPRWCAAPRRWRRGR